MNDPEDCTTILTPQPVAADRMTAIERALQDA